jgi:fatty-acyl-CoA synthase
MSSLSLVRGVPLKDEPGLGALTLPGYLREITQRFADREALVMHSAAGVERWSYTDLWERSLEVARALVSVGVGKDSRVGILMTNRPEFLSGVFGTALAGGVAVMLNTFSTPAELDYMLKASSVSVLLFESRVAKKDFAAILGELEAGVRSGQPGRLMSNRFPFLRYLAEVGTSSPQGAMEGWVAGDIPCTGECDRTGRAAYRHGGVVFLLGLDRAAKRDIERAAGYRHSSLALGTDIQSERRRTQLDAQRFLLVG